MTLTIPTAGSPIYIPKLSAITDNPNPRTSDSDPAFSIIPKVDNNGVNPSLIASLNIGLSRSMSAIVGENV